MFIAFFRCLTTAGSPFLLFMCTKSWNISSDGSKFSISEIFAYLLHSDAIIELACSTLSYDISFLLMIGRKNILAFGQVLVNISHRSTKSSLFTSFVFCRSQMPMLIKIYFGSVFKPFFLYITCPCLCTTTDKSLYRFSICSKLPRYDPPQYGVTLNEIITFHFAFFLKRFMGIVSWS